MIKIKENVGLLEKNCTIHNYCFYSSLEKGCIFLKERTETRQNMQDLQSYQIEKIRFSDYMIYSCSNYISPVALLSTVKEKPDHCSKLF